MADKTEQPSVEAAWDVWIAHHFMEDDEQRNPYDAFKAGWQAALFEVSNAAQFLKDVARP